MLVLGGVGVGSCWCWVVLGSVGVGVGWCWCWVVLVLGSVGVG